MRCLPGQVAVLLGIAVAGVPAVAAAQPLPRSTADRRDDVAGPQVHMVYAIPSDGQDRALDTDGTIENSVAGFQEWLSVETGGRTLRVDTMGGAVDVTFVRLSETETEIRAHDPAIVNAIAEELDGRGFNAADKIYAVYYDGISSRECGGSAWPPHIPGHVAAMYLKGDPDEDGNGDPTDDDVDCADDPAASYWQYAMLHDVVHAAGFVQPCAPNHGQRTHVTDDPTDLMFSHEDDHPNWNPPRLDVNRDDYYEHGRDCADLTDSPYLTPRLPAGNLTVDASFETSTRGFGAGPGGALARTFAKNAPHGVFAARVAPAPGATVSFISDCPVGIIGCSVGNTVGGATYVAAAHVRAATPSAVGKRVTIALREYTFGGALVSETLGQTVTLTTSFQRLGVAAEARASGHVMGVRVQQKLPASTDAFLADVLTLVPARQVMQVVGNPTFGAPVTWTAVGVNAKRASSARLVARDPVDIAHMKVALDGRGAAGAGGQPLRGVVFHDDGGLAGRTEEFAIASGAGAGTVTLRFAPPLRLAPGSYWLGLHAGGSSAIARYGSTGGLGGLRVNADQYADGTADPFGPSTAGTATVPILAIGG
jgi:hypothetical protein